MTSCSTSHTDAITLIGLPRSAGRDGELRAGAIPAHVDGMRRYYFNAFVDTLRRHAHVECELYRLVGRNVGSRGKGNRDGSVLIWAYNGNVQQC